MSNEQIVVFIVMGLSLILFVWGRWRYDVVALLALMVLVLTGIVESSAAFAGFGHPAVITVAAVLVISRGLRNAGVVDILARGIAPFAKYETVHIVALSCLVAVTSAFMNNVGALALLMPVALESAQKHDRSPALVLMPLAFASILGGMMTMIGTPPNIIIATYRETMSPGGEPFGLFDFFPVGAAVAAVGIFFVATVGWRLIPRQRRGQSSPDKLFRIAEYVTEVEVPKESDWIGRTLGDLEAMKEDEVVVAGLIRDKKRRLAPAPSTRIEADDIIILKADPAELPEVVQAAKLKIVSDFQAKEETLRSDDVGLIEAVVPPDSALVGRTPISLRLRAEGRTNLIAMARQGRAVRERLRRVKFQAGDVLLLQGAADSLAETATAVGLLPLAKRNLRIGKARRPIIAISIFGIALLLSAFGVVPAAITLVCAVVIFALFDFVSVRMMYEAVDWSVIVLLAAMIPVGEALQTTGATELVSSVLLSYTQGLHVAVILGLVMVVTMTLSDVINNAATAVVMAPIAVSLAERLDGNPDAFLMSVAVGASCAFLTPIGHQCNTLVLGPGGYRFGDYWRMGLPLEIIIVCLGVPQIMYFWPPF